MINTLISAVLTALISITPKAATTSVPSTTLAVRGYSMSNRWHVESVNEVMRKNILLAVAYINGSVTRKSDIDWTKVTADSHSEFVLEPNQTFAFHNIVRPEFKDNLAVTQDSSFSSADGYVSDGYLFGDGVCDLASLMNWAAQDAGLTTVVPKDHRSVAQIPDVPDDYGVSIYKDPSANIGANNNLYITNTLDNAVKFSFDYQNDNLKVTVSELS